VFLIDDETVDVDRGCHQASVPSTPIAAQAAYNIARMRVLNSTQMREADRRTIEEIGIPSLVLMENAGRQVVAAMEATHSDLLERRVAVLCGRGNNG
jgi:hypothetical protein